GSGARNRRLAAGRNDDGRHTRTVRDVRRRAGQRACRAADLRRVGPQGRLLRLARKPRPGSAPESSTRGDRRIRGGALPRAAAALFPATARTNGRNGEVAEWLNAAVSKTVIPLRVSGVRIPPSPPLKKQKVESRK